LSADLVIFIPPKESDLKDQPYEGYQIEVGKGQYEEFINASILHKIDCELYIENSLFSIVDCDTFLELEQTWQNWGMLFTESYIDGIGPCIKDTIELYFPELRYNHTKTISNLISNNLKKLLIK
jgi:hypothetical protein